MRRLALAVGAAVALQIVTACAVRGVAGAVVRGPASPGGSQAAGSLYPLEAGLRWDYVLRQSHDGSPLPERVMQMGVARRHLRPDGRVEALLERRYRDYAMPATRVLADDRSVVLARASDPEDGPSITVLRAPLEVGQTWPGRPLSGGNEESIAVIGEEDVTVPAGSWRAVRIDHRLTYADGDGDVLSYWYARGVGCVRMIERTTIYVGPEKRKLAVEGLLTARVPQGWPASGRPAAPWTVGSSAAFVWGPLDRTP